MGPSGQSLAHSGQPLSIPDHPSCVPKPFMSGLWPLVHTFRINPQPLDFRSDLQTLYPNPRTSHPTSRTFMSTSGTPFPLLGPLGPPFGTLPCQNCSYCRGARPPRLWSTPSGPSWPTPGSMPTLTLWVTGLSLLNLTWPTPNLGTSEVDAVHKLKLSPILCVHLPRTVDHLLAVLWTSNPVPGFSVLNVHSCV